MITLVALVMLTVFICTVVAGLKVELAVRARPWLAPAFQILTVLIVAGACWLIAFSYVHRS